MHLQHKVLHQFTNGHGTFNANTAVLTQANFPLAQKTLLMPFTARSESQRGAGPSHLAKADKPVLMQRAGPAGFPHQHPMRHSSFFKKTKNCYLESGDNILLFVANFTLVLFCFWHITVAFNVKQICNYSDY